VDGLPPIRLNYIGEKGENFLGQGYRIREVLLGTTLENIMRNMMGTKKNINSILTTPTPSQRKKETS
jgi:hypothetical protein